MRIISGEYKGRALKTTTGPGFRPAMGKVREALFSILESNGVTWPGTRVLDLFAGSGSLGFEALSRGAELVCFVESASYAANVISENARHLGVDEQRFSVRRDEAGKFLAKRAPAPFSVVFIDPPYQLRVLPHVLGSLLKNGWLADGGIVNAEVEARTPFDPAKAHPELLPLADRAYGQTRVILWMRTPLTP